eukprot:7125310-Prymnesium_polylepis.1
MNSILFKRLLGVLRWRRTPHSHRISGKAFPISGVRKSGFLGQVGVQRYYTSSGCVSTIRNSYKRVRAGEHCIQGTVRAT